MCNVTQFVMAYKIKKTQIQRLLPKNFHSLRGVLRVNIEMMSNVPWLEGRDCIRVELNTPVSQDDRRGWFNLATWENCFISSSNLRDIPINTAAKAVISAMKSDMSSTFTVWNEKDDAPFLSVEFERTGEVGGCPAEEDNEGTFYYSKVKDKVTCYFKSVEVIDSDKEYCDCKINWDNLLVHNVPHKYKHLPMICGITNEEILGAYVVKFERVIPEEKYIMISK